MNYWGLIANPQLYDIERAVRELETDSWTTGRSMLEAGDQGVVWKALGKSRERGIIAFFEVLEDSAPRFEIATDYWIENGRASREEMRAIVRYISSDDLPYWYGAASAHILDQTTLPRAQQSIAKITEEQWELLREAIRV